MLGEQHRQPALPGRYASLTATVLAFVVGCVLAASVYLVANQWCLALPLGFAVCMTALWPRDGRAPAVGHADRTKATPTY